MNVQLVRCLSVALLLWMAQMWGIGRAAVPQPTDNVSSPTMQYFREGTEFFVRQDYKDAIGPYSKALELEKARPTLNRTLWRVLVDSLGMAYGISGDLRNAKATFEYGLGRDSVYPMFYYNLACTYAEMNDLDNTIANLRLAFKNRKNGIAGEQMPDPAQDDSFQKFLKNDRFVAVLHEIAQDAK